MKQNQVEIDGSRVTISAIKPPILIRIILTVFLFLLFLIPIAATLFVLTFGDGLHVGIAFTYLLCWGVGFYLLRITLWNSFGQEILTLNPNEISYIADYRLFQDGRQEISTQDLETEIITKSESDKTIGRLKLGNKTAVIETVISAAIGDLEVLEKEIKTRYNNR